MLDGLSRVVHTCDDLTLQGARTDLEAALPELLLRNPQVLIIGQPPSSKSVLPLLARAREAGVTAHIILWVSSTTDVDSFRALQMGARGVISRMQSGERLVECIRAVAGGNVWLESGPECRSQQQSSHGNAYRITPREREIIQLVCRGLKNKEIAAEMTITAGTVKVHLMHIFEKTGFRDRFQLALRGRQLLGLAGSETPELRDLDRRDPWQNRWPTAVGM